MSSRIRDRAIGSPEIGINSDTRDKILIDDCSCLPAGAAAYAIAAISWVAKKY